MKNNYDFKKIILLVLILFRMSSFSQAPPYLWSFGLGPIGIDRGVTVCSDASGNVYAMGTISSSVDFNPGPAVAILSPMTGTLGTGESIYIAKYDAMGNYIWAKSIGNDLSIYQGQMCVDNNGNIIVNGGFQNVVDFDPGPATFTMGPTTYTGPVQGIFVLKLDNNGNFLWAKKATNAADNYIYGMTVDNAGKIYSCGMFANTLDFDPGPGSFNITPAGLHDAFLWVLDAQGNFFFAKGYGGTGSDIAYGVCLDVNGNIFLTGTFVGTADFDPGPAVVNLSSASAANADGYVLKLDVSGFYLWAKNFGGTTSEYAYACVTSSLGEVYCTGSFRSIADFDPGTGVVNLTSSGMSDAYILKLDAAGNYMWVKQIGGTNTDEGISLVTDAQGRLYTVGTYQGTVDFDPGTAVANISSAGNQDGFISQLDAAGNYVWAGSLGDNGFVTPRMIFCGTTGDILLTGDFGSTADMDPGPGISTNTIVAGTFQTNAFVVKLGACNAPQALVDATPPAGRIKCSGNNNQFTLTVSGMPVSQWFASSTGTNVLTTGFSYVTPSLQAVGVYTYYAENSTCGPAQNRIAITVTIASCTGLENLNADKDLIQIYPNPGAHLVHVETPVYKEAFIVNTLGQYVMTLPVDQSKMNIDVSGLQPGIYFIIVRTIEKEQSKKFVRSD